MPNLVIVIPFTADVNCDLDRGATDMRNFFNSIANHNVGENIGTQINQIDIVYRNTVYNCANGDYVIVFAHGGDNNTVLANNQGQTITMNNTIGLLENIGVNNTARVLFMCCFSGVQGHIARVWKARHPAQQTYGGNGVIANLYSSTRTQIRAVCAALGQL
ncbi:MULTISPECIES: hypothetical protein [Dickeya]|uniref:Uncharacterized protein n=2 Tax=Dickeya solani TaxID=1089444 RepID=A0AAP1XMB3_9GAMM|nr:MULTISPECIES: hypothetical protein [Dickeya]ANE75142.1 hypothetical protein A4U42_07225 [Dickeya solani IPO 2222]AUH09444.1 hypothetical protein BJD21_13810 [Dickeya solani D s0432-1]AUH13417.1 hypothetical protein BJJ98_13780 [Dickeya solani]AYQ49678.1 hypothetical protein CTB91_03939 [Dickeya solani]AYQ53842.1 hypothetical protein DSOL99_03937 [Dickeya solani]